MKFVRSLYAKKRRYEERAFIIEGVRLVEDALAAGLRPSVVLYQPDVLSRTTRGSSLPGELGHDVWPVSERVLKSISDTMVPQGIVAVVPFSMEPLKLEGTLALILDGIRDPGNMGTILRTAAAANVVSVVATGDCVDLYSPKVVRAGMGAHFRLGLLIDRNWEEIRDLAEGRAIRLAATRGGEPYYLVNWAEPSGLIVGSEAHGASPEATRMATEMVSIPMAPGVESLNASVATGVLLFEAFKQQSKRDTV